jgi:glucosamine--fructose-6-phosphate aminotransferase (isomerizing)
MSRMRQEALQAPDAAARLLAQDEGMLAELVQHLVRCPPRAVLTVARGSSDHAAHYLAYLAMARLGLLVTSLPMSLITLYPARIAREGLLALAFSQSGQSPDLLAPMRWFSDGGADTVAVVNDAASPLAQAARWVLPLHAGPEHSVAATKSYLCQLVAAARLVAAWQAQRDGEHSLLQALAGLPEAMTQAAALDWGAALPLLHDAQRLMVVGRGTGLAVAMEAALKLKETCAIQAEAFSAAEVKHGPMALVEAGYPMLVLAPRGPAQPGLLALAAEMRERGARVLLAAPAEVSEAELPLATTGHEELDAITTAQSFYGLAEALARARGLDPDAPRHLAKVTRTR